MSEYFTFEIERTDDPDVREFITNQRLTHQDEEIYPDPSAGETGSPIAQTLFFAVDGIQALTIVEDTLIVRRQPAIPWEMLADDIRDALRDFFL
jgi:hypothetical protein